MKLQFIWDRPNVKHTHLSIETNIPLCGTNPKRGPWLECNFLPEKHYLCQMCVTRSHELGLSEPTNQKISKKLKGNKNGKMTRQYSVNSNIFSEVDTADKAYWFGFLMADGWVHFGHNGGACLGLKLAGKDRDHLCAFKKFMESEHPIKDVVVSNRQYSSLIISSIDLVNTLVSKGLTPNKSKTVMFPTWMNEHLLSHFIRGVFDGDGWICCSKKGVLNFGIVGARSLLNPIQNQLIISCRVKKNKLLVDKRHTTSEIVSVVYGGNLQCKRIYDYLYSEATIYLQRKESIWRRDKRIVRL